MSAWAAGCRHPALQAQRETRGFILRKRGSPQPEACVRSCLCSAGAGSLTLCFRIITAVKTHFGATAENNQNKKHKKKLSSGSGSAQGGASESSLLVAEASGPSASLRRAVWAVPAFGPLGGELGVLPRTPLPDLAPRPEDSEDLPGGSAFPLRPFSTLCLVCVLPSWLALKDHS